MNGLALHKYVRTASQDRQSAIVAFLGPGYQMTIDLCFVG